MTDREYDKDGEVWRLSSAEWKIADKDLVSKAGSSIIIIPL